MTSAIATTTTGNGSAMTKDLDPKTKRFVGLRDFLTSRKANVAAVAGKALDTERVLKIVLDAAANTPALLSCTPESLLRAMMFCAKVQLEPIGAWGVWLVPFGSSVTPIIDYRALMGLVKRSGDVRTIVAHPVYEKDAFDVCFGDEESIVHRPEIDSEKRGKLVAVYSIATLKDGLRQRNLLSKADIDRYRAKSRASGSGPWVTDYEAMALKTTIKRLCNYLPIPTELSRILDEENVAESFDPVVTIDTDSTPVENAPAEIAANATPAEQLKSELRGKKAPPAAKPIEKQEVAPPEPPQKTESSPPLAGTTGAPATASSSKDPFVAFVATLQANAEAALSEGESKAFNAHLGAKLGELAALIGKEKAQLEWKGGKHAVKSKQGVRTHGHALERLDQADRLVKIAKLDQEMANARKSVLGCEGGEQLVRGVPNATHSALQLTEEQAQTALDALLDIIEANQEEPRVERDEDLPVDESGGDDTPETGSNG